MSSVFAKGSNLQPIVEWDDDCSNTKIPKFNWRAMGGSSGKQHCTEVPILLAGTTNSLSRPASSADAPGAASINPAAPAIAAGRSGVSNHENASRSRVRAAAKVPKVK
ncbi:MAG TPA: hypothetical protein PLD10_21050 [Rhodopila sp.]|nr:hypothetical protein [Rhodopila sp.]